MKGNNGNPVDFPEFPREPFEPIEKTTTMTIEENTCTKAYRYELYPSPAQIRQFKATIAACDFVRREAVRLSLASIDAHERRPRRYDIQRLLPIWKEEHPWLAKADALALVFELRFVDKAFKDWHNGAVKRPRITRDEPRQSYTTGVPPRKKKPLVSVAGKRRATIALPKAGDVPIGYYRPYEGRPVNLNIKCDSCNRWWVSICAEKAPLPDIREPAKDIAGIHLALATAACSSEGERLAIPYRKEPNRSAIKSLRAQIRKVERHGRADTEARRKLSRLIARRANRVRETQLAFVREMVDTYGTLVMSDYNVRELRDRQGAYMREWFNTVQLGRLKHLIRYKTAWHKRTLIETPRDFAMVSTCSVCDTRVIFTGKTAPATWECPVCHTVHDKNLNAAANNRRLGQDS